MNVKIKLVEGGILPEYKTSGSVGADCFARLDSPIIVLAGTIVKIPLGFAVELPDGFEMHIRPRSGLAFNYGIYTITGTIDSDYRGEVCALIHNASSESYVIRNQDRIAQVVISPVIKADWKISDNLNDTERGIKGFGSTGK